jgi:uncharacterized protein YacL (UPF0231 family)
MPNEQSGQEQQTDQQGQQNQQTQTSDQTLNGQQGQQNQQEQQGQAQGQRQQPQGERTIPYSRFQQVNTGYQTEKQRADQLAAQLDQATRQIHALAGVRNVAPEELEVNEIRGALARIVPGLDKLSPEMIERLVEIAQNGEQIQETNRTIWKNHGLKMIRSAQDNIADTLRVEKLTDRQKSRIGREYTTFIEENSYMDENNQPAGAILRHEAGDDSLVEEFVKAFLEDWQESIRKSVVSSEVRPLRAVPSGKGRSVVVGKRKEKINYNDPKAFGDALVESFKDHGGSFGE